jgi:protein-S-isoprenylcysteine O-methyltransferase Ste14
MRRLLDGFERIVVLTLFILLLHRFAESWQLNIIYLVAEALPVVMLLVRRSTDHISMAPRDWLVAFIGTFSSMLIVPAPPLESMAPVGVFLSIGGLAMSVSAKLALNRSFGVVAANRGVKTRGVYQFVRHPMYLGYFLTQSGVLILNRSYWNLLVLAVWAVCQVLRIVAEERVLTADPAYLALRQRVPYRLFPYVY